MFTQSDVVNAMDVAKDGWGTSVQDASALLDGLRVFMGWEHWTSLVPETGERSQVGGYVFRQKGGRGTSVQFVIQVKLATAPNYPQGIAKKFTVTIPDDKGDYARGQPLAIAFGNEPPILVNVLDPRSVTAFYHAASGVVATLFTDAAVAYAR